MVFIFPISILKFIKIFSYYRFIFYLFILINYFFLAHISHLQNQPQNQTNIDLDKKLRRQKEMMEQMLSQKVGH